MMITNRLQQGFRPAVMLMTASNILEYVQGLTTYLDKTRDSKATVTDIQAEEETPRREI